MILKFIFNFTLLFKRGLLLLFIFLFFNSTLLAHHRDTFTVHQLEFVENKTQWEEQILYKASLQGGVFFAEKERITYVFLNSKQLADFNKAKRDPSAIHSGFIDATAYQVNFVNANKNVEVSGENQCSSYNNYYLGNNPEKWSSKVRKFHKIRYRELYDGIDLFFLQKDFNFKYEFVVKPGANPQDIQLEYEGMKGLILSKGNLIVSTTNGQIIELKPFAYQLTANGDTITVDCNYKIKKQKTVVFSIENYNTSLPLIIDPVLIFSTYSGSTADNWGYSATYDRYGNAYSGGNVFNIGYPTTLGAYQINYGGGSCDIAISKFDALGSFLHFSTYLGGSGTDIPHSLIVNSNDELVVLGTTSSSDYPVTPDAYSTTFQGGSYYLLTSVLRYNDGSDIVLTKFNSSGTALLGSTYIGGSGNDGLNTVAGLKKNYADEVRGEVNVDEQNNIYIVSSTQSTDFPVTAGVLQPQHNGGVQDACIIKMNHNLTNMIWSSCLGGSGDDAAYSMVLASDKSIYLCGGTNSFDFPITANAVQPSFAGGVADGYVAHISPNGNQLLHSTFMGRSGYDQSYLIKNDRNNYPHIFGQTDATGVTWIQNVLWFVPSGGQFLTKLSPSLDTIVWSTAFGRGLGGIDISPTALLVDLCNNIYMSGWGSPVLNAGQGGTAGLPITADAFQVTTNNNDYYFICITDDVSSLVYATYFGSPNALEHVDGGTSRFDNKGRIYQAVCAGCGGFSDFPTTPGAWSEINGSSNCNIGIIKFDFDLPAIVADFYIPPTVCAPISLTFNNMSQSISPNTQYFWDFGDGSTSTEYAPTHAYIQSGIYQIRLIVQDLGSCNFTDTMTRQLVVLANTNRILDPVGICAGDFVQIGIPPSGSDETCQWTPTTNLDNPTISNPIASPTTTTQYTLYVSNGVCTDTLRQTVIVDNLQIDAGNNDTICTGDTAYLVPSIVGNATQFYWSRSPNFTNIINSNTSQATLTVSPYRTTTYYLKAVSQYCEIVDSVKVVVIPFYVTSPPFYTICYEDSTQISVRVSPQGTYLYDWQPTQTIIDSSNVAMPWVNPLVNTIYTATVTNEYGCVATATVTVNIKKLEADIVTTPVSCYQESDGTATITPTEGLAPYFYQWSNGATTPNLINLPAGEYIVLITDSLGCKTIDTIIISEPSPITVSLVTVTPVVCDQICNGSMTITASGGTGNLTFHWLHDSVGPVLTDLCAGIYTVKVTDENQCTVVASFPLPDTSSNSIAVITTPPLCYGDCNGRLALDLDFNMPYSVLWDNGLTDTLLDSLCAGNYHAFITETSGCTYDIYSYIPEVPPLEFANIFTHSPSCYGDADGIITLQIRGGTPPYRYFIDNNSAQAIINNLASGTYHLTVMDANDCRIDSTFWLSEPNPILVTERHNQPPCPQVCNATLSLTVEGGTPPYRYNWSNGNNLPYGESLCVGTYTITTKDVNNCVSTITVTIQDSSLFPVDIHAWSDVDTLYKGATTNIHATELENFSYQWTPPTGVASPTSPNSAVTPPNTISYVIVVRDRYGCEKSDTVTIFVKDVICDEPYIFVPSAFSPNYDGINDILYVRGETIEKFVLRVYDRWGALIFETKDQNKGWDGTYKNKECPAGVYDYYLEVWCLGEKQYFKKGNVTLLR